MLILISIMQKTESLSRHLQLHDFEVHSGEHVGKSWLGGIDKSRPFRLFAVVSIFAFLGVGKKNRAPLKTFLASF